MHFFVAALQNVLPAWLVFLLFFFDQSVSSALHFSVAPLNAKIVCQYFLFQFIVAYSKSWVKKLVGQLLCFYFFGILHINIFFNFRLFAFFVFRTFFLNQPQATLISSFAHLCCNKNKSALNFSADRYAVGFPFRLLTCSCTFLATQPFSYWAVYIYKPMLFFFPNKRFFALFCFYCPLFLVLPLFRSFIIA